MGVVYYKEQTIPNVSAFTEDIRYVTSALNIKLGAQMKLKSWKHPNIQIGRNEVSDRTTPLTRKRGRKNS